MRRIFRGSLLALCAVSLSGCVTTTIETGPPEGSTTPSEVTTTAEEGPDLAVCEGFFGTPSYEGSLFYRVLSSAGDDTVTSVDKDVSDAVENLGADTKEVSGPLSVIADAAAGTASRDDLAQAVDDLGVACGDLGSETAAYATGHGEDGGKPVSMTCSDMLSKPQTIDVFGNSNVLPSNSFRLVGMSGSWVNDPAKGEAVAAQIQREIDATGDETLRGLLEDFREPFLGQGSGVKAPLDELTIYCDEAGR